MRRLRIVPLAVVVGLSAGACLTEDTKCPSGHKKVRGLCVEVAGHTGDLDSGTDDDVHSRNDGAPITPTECYLDWDHDGSGAGDEVDCDDPFAGLPAADAGTLDAGDTAAAADGGAVAALPAVVHRNDDCDDHDPKRAPTLKELCDGVDNNCNSDLDDSTKNACGGTCTRVLDHAPGDDCDNGLQGACARPGKFICQGETDVVCNAPQIAASSELCGDDIDNDCDGVSDEPDAVNASYWYQDCDGDGYAASTTGGVQSCAKPANAGSCGWSQVVPQPTTRTNWDCNDSNGAYSPSANYGRPPQGFTNWDLNCDGVVTPRPNDPNSAIDACSVVVANWANNLGEDCSVSDIGPLGCYLWKNQSGKYVTTPSTCPDDPYQVLENSSTAGCSILHWNNPVWFCR